MADDFVCQALAVVGLELPGAGLHCSALLGVEERIRFADEVLPEAIQQAASGASEPQLRLWLEERIGSWGGDGIGMTAQGYSWWRQVEAANSGLSSQQLSHLDRVWESH